MELWGGDSAKIKQIDPDAKIILTGISMGAATVMIAAGQELPPQVPPPL